MTTLGWNGRNSGNSRITFDGYSLPGQGNLDFTDFGSPFALGKLSFQNGGACGLPGIDSLDLTLSFLWGNTSTASIETQFGLTLTEQNTSSGRRHHGRRGDLLTLSSTDNSFEFDTDAGKYRLDLLGWSRDGGQSFVNTVFGADHSISHLKLYAALQAVQTPPPPESQAVVPVPAAFWLLGSGLIALIGAARRR